MDAEHNFFGAVVNAQKTGGGDQGGCGVGAVRRLN
jgi:hypothetical protein